jgi:hypothetical protein
MFPARAAARAPNNSRARRAGPGAFDFRQSDTNGTAFWRLVRRFIHEPTAAQAACHAPKPILLDTGSLAIPYAWRAPAPYSLPWSSP